MRRWRGADFFLDLERAAGVVQSGESLHRTVGMMEAPLESRSPCWGHHGEARCSHRVDSRGEDLIYVDVGWQRLGVVTFLEASHLESHRLCGRGGRLEVLREASLVRVAVKVRRAHGCLRT
jgi:hypothetical protein